MIAAPTHSKNELKNVDLMFCHLGNGLTVVDRLHTENGDYIKVAHISETGQISWYKAIPSGDYDLVVKKAWDSYGFSENIRGYLKRQFPNHKEFAEVTGIKEGYTRIKRHGKYFRYKQHELCPDVILYEIEHSRRS